MVRDQLMLRRAQDRAAIKEYLDALADGNLELAEKIRAANPDILPIITPEKVS